MPKPITITIQGENQGLKTAARESKDELKGLGDAGKTAGKEAATGAKEAADALKQIDGSGPNKATEALEKEAAAARKAASDTKEFRREIKDALKDTAEELKDVATDGFGGKALGSMLGAKDAFSSGGGNPFAGFMGDAGTFQEEIASVIDSLKEMHAAGEEGGGEGGGADLDELKENLAAATEKGKALSEKLGDVRDAALGVAAVGAGGVVASNFFAGQYEEGQGEEEKLESILKQQHRGDDVDTLNESVGSVAERGHFSDDDELRSSLTKILSFNVATKDAGTLLELAARQARTMGVEVGGVSEQLAKAMNTGQVSMLKKSGITISDEDIDRIEKAYEISREMGQQKFMEIIGPAIKENTVALEDSLTGTQAAANDAARALDDFNTNVGEGSAQGGQWFQIVKGGIASIVNEVPGLEKTGGLVFSLGSQALAAGGSIVAFVAQLGQAWIGLKMFQAAQAAKKAATDLDTASTEANAAAQVVNAGATDTAAASAVVDAAAQDTLAASEGAAAIGAEAEAAAATTAATATTVAGAAALGAAAAFATIATVVIGLGVGLGMLVTEGLRRIGVIDSETSAVDRLSNAWARMKEMAGGEKAGWSQNQADIEAEIEKRKTENSEAVSKGTKTQAQADEDNRKFEIEKRDWAAKQQFEQGDKIRGRDNQEKSANLKKQDESQASAAKAMAAVGAPSASVPVTATTPGAAPSSVSSVGGIVPSTVGESGGSVENTQAEIDLLKAQLRGLQFSFRLLAAGRDIKKGALCY